MKRLILFTLLLVLIAAVSAESQTLFINEFMASNDAAVTDENGEYDDWIEIYNAGSEPVDIGGMYLTDDLSDPTTWQIPAAYPDSTTIQPGGFLVLWADKESEQGVLHLELKLSGDGEQIGLVQVVDTDTMFVDSLTYTAQTTDISYARFPDGSSTWKFFDQSTPGAFNGEVDLIINEFMASNDSAFADEFGGYDDWIEIYNPNDMPIDIGGMYITDDLSDPVNCQIPRGAPDTTTIPAGGFLVLWADKESEQGVLHLELKLSGDGEQVGLAQIAGTDTIFADSLTYYQQSADTSYGRIADGGVEWGFFSTSTPGESNSGGVLVGIKDEHNPTVSDFKLLQNYPNPFNPATKICFQLSKSNAVNITIYNLNGEKIQTLVNKPFARGSYTAEWNGTNQNGLTVSSGIYIYTMTIDNAIIQSRKMIYMK
ncbi:MAG: lamin tail domain-containing protein [Calditrichales bacterium]|nr:lamin tail domain-containing protein [Calditrichales bacterium]